MKDKKLKLCTLGSILIISLFLISMTHVTGIESNEDNLQTDYIPVINDYFTYTGDNEQVEIQIEQRHVTNSTTGDLIDYYYGFLEILSREHISNASFLISGMDQSLFGANMSINGFENTPDSYIKNDTKAYNMTNRNWNNQSSLLYMNETPFNQEMAYKFGYASGTVPSSMVIGDNMNVNIGMDSIPIGGDDSGNSVCAPEDLAPFTIQNGGQISLPSYYPFDNLSEFQLLGIFKALAFDWSSFKQDNQAYLNNNVGNNITWTTVELGLISGIDPTLDGMVVVLVYQLAKNFGTGMLEATDNYCNSSSGGGSPFDYFGNFSVIPLTWTEVDKTNRPFVINGFNYNLATKTYQGLNDTSVGIQVNMSLGDQGSNFYAMVNLSLQVHVGIYFEYDITTGFMVDFKTDLAIFLGMNADNIKVPLGNSSYTGTATINSTMSMANHMDFTLAQHSSLYQSTSQTNTTLTKQTNTTNSTSPLSQSTITTTDFPTFILILALPMLILFRKKKNSK